jgi:hypothetical protein
MSQASARDVRIEEDDNGPAVVLDYGTTTRKVHLTEDDLLKLELALNLRKGDS